MSPRRTISSLRACGECRACCCGPEIAALGKQRFEPCSHLTELGCGIYGQHPESCKQYECSWKAWPDIFVEDERPDSLGVYFVVQPSKYDGLTGQVIQTTIEAWETSPGRIDAPRAQATIERVLAHFAASSEGTLEGMEVVRFGDPVFHWIAYPGGTPFVTRKQQLEEVGEEVEPFARREPKHRLDVIE